MFVNKYFFKKREIGGEFWLSKFSLAKWSTIRISVCWKDIPFCSDHRQMLPNLSEYFAVLRKVFVTFWRLPIDINDRWICSKEIYESLTFQESRVINFPLGSTIFYIVFLPCVALIPFLIWRKTNYRLMTKIVQRNGPTCERRHLVIL